MLEPVILDNTERLLSAAGSLSNISNYTSKIISEAPMICYGADSMAAQPYTFLSNVANASGTFSCWRSDLNNVLLVSNVGSLIYAINLTTGAIAQDSSGMQVYTLLEDTSGVIWAVGINAGYYGLWKRTATATWTLILSDSGQGAMGWYSDGKLYYKSSTGNFYTLSNGAATVATNPASYLWIIPRANNNDNVILSQNPMFSSASQNLPITPGYWSDVAETYSARFWPAWAYNNNTGTKLAPIGNINFEVMMEITQSNILNALNNTYLNNSIFYLSPTYSLMVVYAGNMNNSNYRDGSKGALKVILTVLNKTTGVNKFIGSIYLTGSSNLSISATAAASIYGNVIGAALNTGVLDLWIALGTYITGVSTDKYGLFKKSLTLNLDF